MISRSLFSRLHLQNGSISHFRCRKIIWPAAHTFSLPRFHGALGFHSDSRILRNDSNKLGRFKAKLKQSDHPSSELPHCLTRPPIVFGESTVGDNKLLLKTADVVGVGHVWLDVKQHELMERWASLDDSEHQGTLVLFSGTIKSGKSLLLNKVLPGMAVHYHNLHPATTLQPAFFYFSMPKSHPKSALGNLCQHIQARAADCGIHLPESRDPTALLEIWICKMKVQKKVMLWVLLDEVQNPLLCCKGREASDYGEDLKEIFGSCSDAGGRVAFTGGDMLKLLAQLQETSAGGHCISAEAKILSCGHSYSETVFRQMVWEMFPYYEQLPSDLTVDHVLEQFHKSGTLVSFRPALAAFFLKQMEDGDSCNRAWEVMERKLHEKADLSTAQLLGGLDKSQCRFLYRLGKGELTADDVLMMTTTSPFIKKAFWIVQSLLEDPDVQPPKKLALQPPYGLLFRKWITPCGRLVAEIQGGDVVADKTRGNLQFIAESGSDLQLRREVSNAIQKYFFPGSSKPLQPSDIVDLREFQRLCHLLNSMAGISKDWKPQTASKPVLDFHHQMEHNKQSLLDTGFCA